MTPLIPTTGTERGAASAFPPIRQCDRCRLFAPLDDFGQPGALEAWRACPECRDLVFPRPIPDPTDNQAT